MKKLPTKVTILFKDLGITKTEIKNHEVTEDELGEEIGDYLSDTYGFCFFGYQLDDIDADKEIISVSHIQWDTRE